MENHQAVLSFTPLQQRVQSGETLQATLSLKEGQPLTPYQVELTGVNGAVQEKQVSLTTDANGAFSVNVHFLPDRASAGTAALLATSGKEVTAANLNLKLKPGQAVITTQQELEASYPHLTGPNMGPGSAGIKPASLKPLVAQPQGLGEPVPDVALIDNVQYILPNGKLSEQMSGIQYGVPGTGSGQPSKADLEQNPTPSLSAQYACGTQQVSVTFTNTVDSITRPIPKGTYIRASEQNFLPDSIQAEGWIGDNGVFTFPMQICDSGETFSKGKPDLYFILETRNNVGLTETHGTFARRHWWRTNTWNNTSPAAINGMTVRITGSNAEAELARQLWYNVNRVNYWHRSAMSSYYTDFPLDVLYPVSTYQGIAPLARAAIRQIQIPYATATDTSTVFHEFGHEVYYRQLLGGAAWATYNTATGAAFPTCGGCLGHSYTTNSGPEAAMIEGWADFFAAVTTRTLGYSGDYLTVEKPDDYYVVPRGLGNELRVAAYLYDRYDNDTEEFNFDGVPNSSRTDDDYYKTTGTAAERFSKVAKYFFNAPLSSEFQQHWLQRIKPALSASGVVDNCALLRLNTLEGADVACQKK